jgi:hypothetical protein
MFSTLDDGISMLYIALLHYPVKNKTGEIIGSAVTNLDLHDIARAARTYGVCRYYVSTPFADQKALVKEITDHWQTGHGARSNPARCEALSIIRVAGDLDEIIEEIGKIHGTAPYLVMTSARKQGETIDYREVRELLEKQQPVLLVFGTAHGLADQVMAKADGVLPPITGSSGYNHLSVRSAAAIILDRLSGN